MDSKIQPVPGYYVWDVPGQPAIVYLNLDTLDRLEAEILRGYGAMPKRGVEVGGLLLGATEPGPDGRVIVRIRDFDPIGCSYKRGSLYLLDDEESQNFEQTFEHWKADTSRPLGAVGYYRSNTRDEPGLDAEDIARMDRHFPQAEAVALLVRPNASKPSVAGFLMRENGTFPSASPREFPFHRRERTDLDPAPREPVFERPAPPKNQAQAESAPRFRGAWLWMPLCFAFLLIGVVLGFPLGVSLGPRVSTTSAAVSDFALGLTVSRAEDNLNVHWNRDALGVRSAQKGVLEIEDGGYTKPVDLDQAHLQNGSVIYRHTSDAVRFRLTVYLGPRSTLTETLDWRQ